MIDKRIEEGDAVEEVQKTRGYKLIFERIDAERYTAMKNALLVSKDSSAGINWRTRLSTLDWVFGMVEGFLVARDVARGEKEVEKDMPKEHGEVEEVTHGAD